MTTVVVATNNAKKLKEIREILASVAPGVAILTAADIALGEPEENGETFRANALIKALAAFDKSGAISLADDSGLEVDALGGEPGVHSAYYAGRDGTRAERDARNNRRLVERLRGAAEFTNLGADVEVLLTCLSAPAILMGMHKARGQAPLASIPAVVDLVLRGVGVKSPHENGGGAAL